MSSQINKEAADADVMMMRCASFGVKEDDGITLKKCNVKYCGVKCQKEHWTQHIKECKKRTAELRDELLFKQPESSHLGDCPICCLPLSVDKRKSVMMSCCGKLICNGCDFANNNRVDERNRRFPCPFCRQVRSVGERT